jgi:hypothetical protein
MAGMPPLIAKAAATMNNVAFIGAFPFERFPRTISAI